jgi:pyruvate dehydrogenase E1 component alpha subunit
MSDPGTTYRSRDEVQAVRSERDAIAGLKKYILEWGATDEASLKAIDKAAKEEVDVAVAEAKESPQPDLAEFWKDIYVSLFSLHQRQELMKSVQGYRAPFHAWT